jgi:hypothetical protein
VTIPALGLFISGLLALLPGILLGLSWLSSFPELRSQFPEWLVALGNNVDHLIARGRQDPALGWGLGVFLVSQFLMLPLAGVMLVGAFKMAKLEMRGLALTSSVAAMLPIHLGWLIGMPVGLWALLVLLKADVAAAFRRHAGQEDTAAGAKDARSDATGPAVGLLLTGVLNFVILVILNVVLFGLSRGMPGMQEMVITSLLALHSFLIILGAWKMLQGESLGLAQLSCILALLPCSPGWLLGLPMAIWGLLVLARPEVKEHFAAKTRKETTGPAPLPQQQVVAPAIGLLITGILQCATLLFILFLALQLATPLQGPIVREEVSVDVVTKQIVQRQRVEDSPSPGRANPLPMLLIAYEIVGWTLSVLLILGALAMLRRSSYRLAQMGAIVALLPCSIVWLLGLPMGIWALLVLHKPGVEQAFAGKSQP